MLWERLTAGAVLVAAASALIAAMLPEVPPTVAAPAVLPLTAAPLPLNLHDLAQIRIGALRFRGAVRLTSSNPLFGGVSGLRWRPDVPNGPRGWLLAISDTGNWLMWRPVERRGRLIGIEQGGIAPIIMADGRPVADKQAGDAESLQWRPDGQVAVGFEQSHRVQIWRRIDPADTASLGAKPDSVLRHSQTIGWPSNGGGEALAALADGTLVMVAENARGADGSHDLLLIDGPRATRIGVAVPSGFSPTDAVLLDADRLLLLTRRYDGVSVAAKLLLVDLAPLSAARAGGETARAGGETARAGGETARAGGVVPAALTLGARELATLAPPLTIDNMEGLALRCEAGAVMLYLISDDNLSAAQRTILLKFALDPAVGGRACVPPTRPPRAR